LSFLPGLFKRFSSGNAAQQAPQPQGAWSILVDRDGQRITDRNAQPGDMMARTPQVYHFGGTIPGYKPDPSKDMKENMRRRVEYEIRAAQNKELLEQAVFLLSQTPDGRRLLAMAYNKKFQFVFDPERTTKENAAGLCDYTNKLIPLAEGRSVEQVALTVKHELQHMDDMTHGAGAYGPGDTLASATIANRGLEANARVSEAVFAMEAMLGDPEGPPGQWKSYAVMARFHQKNSHMGEAALNNRGLLKARDNNAWAAFANKVFPAYYKSTGTLAYYDERLAKMYAGGDLRSPDELRAHAQNDPRYRDQPHKIENYIESLKDSMNGILQTARTTAESLPQNLRIRGQSYLKFEKGFDPSSKAARGITEKGMEAFAKLRTKMDALGIRTEDPEALENMPRHKEPRAAKGLGKEFAQAIAKTSETPLVPITLPYRLDGPKDTRGRPHYQFVTERFLEHHERKESSHNPLDKIEFAVTDYLHCCSSGNIMGNVSTILEAGLRAPINAFPPDYLFDLARRIRTSSEHELRPDAKHSSSFTPAELDLMQHWQDMAAAGLSPLWIDDTHKQQSFYGAGDEKMAYAPYILQAIGYEEKKQNAPEEKAQASV